MSRIKIPPTDKAPKPVGPYCQAIAANGLVFLSGQIGIDPKTGALAEDDIGIQTLRVMDNIDAVLEKAGSSWRQVVKVTIFLTDLAHWAKVNIIYTDYIDRKNPPARSAVQVAALPFNAMIEIEVIALSNTAGDTQ